MGTNRVSWYNERIMSQRAASVLLGEDIWQRFGRFYLNHTPTTHMEKNLGKHGNTLFMCGFFVWRKSSRMPHPGEEEVPTPSGS